jgi:hypothetical protein
MWDQIVATAEPHSKLDMVGFLYLNPTYKIGDRTGQTLIFTLLGLGGQTSGGRILK